MLPGNLMIPPKKPPVSLNHVELLQFADADALAAAAATAWLDEIETAARAGQTYCVALSGGRIAHKLFAATATQAAARKTAMAHVHFFWADERCVPPSDPDSNFKVADEFLFRPLRIVTENIHRLRGELAPEQAAQLAATELRRVARQNAAQQSVLDLIFLGLGEDGHIASLFPENTAEKIDTTLPFIVVKNSPKPPPVRISLSYNAINAAKNVSVLVSGDGKESALRRSLSADAQMPLAQVIRERPVKIFSAINEF